MHFVSSEDKSPQTANAISDKSSSGIRKITPFNYYTPSWGLFLTETRYTQPSVVTSQSSTTSTTAWHYTKVVHSILDKGFWELVETTILQQYFNNKLDINMFVVFWLKYFMYTYTFFPVWMVVCICSVIFYYSYHQSLHAGRHFYPCPIITWIVH